MVPWFLTVLLGVSFVRGQYTPDWNSLDTRPLPSWYDEAKFGIFIHWGVFSVPSFGSEWFWEQWQGKKIPDYVNFMQKNFKPGFSYPEFAEEFTAEFYNPNDWADLFRDSGAEYVVLTSKHHEGYTLWPSKVSWNWNAKDIGPKRDLLGDLANAIRNRTSLHFGVYHSLFEWFNPMYVDDKASNWKTRKFVTEKTMPELVELVNTYHPEVVWSDGDWEAPDTYWNSTGFLAWLYNDSPVKDQVVVNDRWGIGITCHHGDFYTCQDNYNPGILVNHKWENAMTVDKNSWGFRRNAQFADYHTTKELIGDLAKTISCNGNLLLNVGPTKDGIISPIFQDRLRELGKWLKVNGEAVYSSRPWKHQNDTVTPDIWYTSKDSSVYVFVLNWPKGNTLTLGSLKLSNNAQVSILGLDGSFKWASNSDGSTTIKFPYLTPDVIPCQNSWVLKISGAIPL